MADRFWVPDGGSSSGTWDSTDHWSATTGGAGGASIPGTGDAVIIDASSDTASADFTITLDMNVEELTSFSDGATTGAGVTTFTSATASFTSAMAGEYLFLNSGTNVTVGRYLINSVTNSTTIVLASAPDSGGAISNAVGTVGENIASLVSTAAISGFTFALGTSTLKTTGNFTMAEDGASGQDITHEDGGKLIIGGDLQTNLLIEDTTPTQNGADLIFTGAAPTWRFETSGGSFSPYFNSITVAASSTLTMRCRSSAGGQDVTVVDNWKVAGGHPNSATITWDTTDTSTNLGMEFGLKDVDVDMDGVFTISNITRFEHENLSATGSNKRVSGDSRASITWGAGTVTYDVTGPASGGPEVFILGGDITGSTSMRLAIEKQAQLELGKSSITNCEQIRLGDTAGDPAFLYCQDGSITSASHLEFDGTDSLLHVGNGTVTVGGHLETNEGGIINGYAGGTLVLNGTTTGVTDIFVRPDGNDANDGSTDPLAVQTFGRAMALATATDHVHFEADGTYPIDAASGTFASIGRYGAGADPIFTLDHGTQFLIDDPTSFWYESQIQWLNPSPPIYAAFTSSRTSGNAPCAVFFDALEDVGTRATTTTVANDKSDASHELEFEWSFDDAGATLVNKPTADLNVARGPMAAHVFESANTYTVTLTVRDSAGNTDSATQVITVSDPAWTDIYCDAGVVGGLNDGTSAANAYTSLDTALADLFGSSGPRRLYVERGETYTPTDGVYSGTGTYLITTSGTGPKPIWDVNGGADAGLTVTDLTDLIVEDQDFDGPPTPGDHGIRGGPSPVVGHRLFLRCEVNSFENGFGTGGNSDYSLTFIQDCIIEANKEYGIRWNYGQHCAFIGNNLIDTSVGGGGFTAEHFTRCALAHSVLQHQTYTGGAANKNVLKFRGWDTESDPRPFISNEFNVISDNEFDMDDSSALICQIGPHDDNDRNQLVENNIIERNIVRVAGTPGQSIGGIISNSPENTIRDNIVIDAQTTSSFTGIDVDTRGSNPAPTNNRIYNNNIHFRAANANNERGVRLVTGTGHTCSNNLIAEATAVTGTVAPITDTSTGATKATNGFLHLDDEIAAGWTNAASEDFTLVSDTATAHIAASPTTSDLEESAMVQGATQIDGMFTDYAQVDRDLTNPDIGAHEYVAAASSFDVLQTTHIPALEPESAPVAADNTVDFSWR